MDELSELQMVEQRSVDIEAAAPWIVDDGRRIRGLENDLRLQALRCGLTRHERVRASIADACDEEVERVLSVLHEPSYLQALRGLSDGEPVVMPELAPPGLAPDGPVCADVVRAAHEGVRTAVAAAQRLLAGARFAYALCRPPGHHAGPAWLGGYCYFNNAAAAALTLRQGGMGPIGILDLDLHYPNGTAAMLARIGRVRLHSLHASPVRNVADEAELPLSEDERLFAFPANPKPDIYLQALSDSLVALACSTSALVVSLGYDTVRGDPHGSWSFHPRMFEEVGRLLAAYRRPVCVIQEGGYELASLILCGEAFAVGLLDREGEPSGIRREQPPWYERPPKLAASTPDEPLPGEEPGEQGEHEDRPAEEPTPAEPKGGPLRMTRAEQALAMWRKRKGWSRRGGRR
jgi:acetoin utilization deacetylase AcuC-like enzyme